MTSPYGLSFTGYGTFTPLAIYRGYGFDSLSAAAGIGRRTSPNYTHVADGSAIELNLAMAWSPVPIWTLEVGYSYYYYFSRRGIQREYYADGSFDDIRLDYARTERRGAFLATSVRF